jgi:predicted porin
MKRNLWTLALLGLAGAGAHAQSSVTMYGIVDLAVEHLTNVGAGGDSLTRMPGLSGSVPSRLGFRGNEDLGGGLRGVFTLEMGIGVDTGTLNQGGRGFGRQSYVGLASDWGSVTLGRQYSMLFWSQTEADLLGPNTFGSGSLDSYLPNARVDNAVAYRGTFGGFDLGASYSFGRDAVNAGPSPSGTNCAGENATDPNQCRQWTAMLKYNAATWGVATAYDKMHGGPGAFAGLTSSSLTDRRSTVAGWFKPLESLKIGAGLIDRDNEGSTTPHSKLWYVGAGYNLSSPLLLEAEVFKLDYQHSANQATLWALRGTYFLSKRTAVYATAGHIGNDGTLALSLSNGAAGANPPAGGSQSGLAMGIRHSF